MTADLFPPRSRHPLSLFVTMALISLVGLSCIETPWEKGSRNKDEHSTAHMFRAGTVTCLTGAVIVSLYRKAAQSPQSRLPPEKRLDLARDLRSYLEQQNPTCDSELSGETSQGVFSSFFSGLSATKGASAETLGLAPSIQALCADYLALTRLNFGISERQALVGCHEAIEAAARRRPLDIHGAPENREEKVYHVTLEKNLDSILRVGLLPFRGGYGGLCQNLTRSGQTRGGLEGEDYAEMSQGFVFWTPRLEVAERFMEDYQRCGQKPALLALRASVVQKNSDPDPCMLPSFAYRTSQWISPVDIQVVRVGRH